MNFEYVQLNMWNTGEEVAIAYATFDIDKRGIWTGRKYVLTNNHVKNSWRIDLMSDQTYMKCVDKGRDETLSLKEFKNWLLDKGVEDSYMAYLRNHPEYVEAFPDIMGAELIREEMKNEKRMD